MNFKPGDVVVLKSGGQPLTVADVHDEDVSCVWIGEEGDLFREKLPAVTLEPVDLAAVELDSDEQDDDSGTEEDDRVEEQAHEVA